MNTPRDTVMSYWKSAEDRDWNTFASLLSPTVTYDLPQTRERMHGRENYLRFNREYPGDWHLAVEEVLAVAGRVVSRVRFTVNGETQTAVTFFDVDAEGLITAILDFWPEPYEPPPGRAELVERY